MKVNRVFDVLCLLVVLAGLALAAVKYPLLPDPMPSHWNAAGDVNGWMPKFWGVMIFPIIMAAIWLMFLVLPRISPRGFEMDPFVRAWGYLRVAFLAFMLFIEVIVLRAAQESGKDGAGRPLRGCGHPVRPDGQFPRQGDSQLLRRHPHAVDAGERGSLATARTVSAASASSPPALRWSRSRCSASGRGR